MTTYERTLLAYGFDPELAKRDAHVNEIQRLDNRERYAAEAAQDASDLNYSEGFRFKYDGAALGAD